MKANRKALLGLIVCATSAIASAQIAPNNQGDIGLFTMPSADTPRAGQVTLGLYGWNEKLTAGNLAFEDTPDQTRLYNHWAGTLSFGLGLTNHWNVFMDFGGERYESRNGWEGGAINSIPFQSDFRADQPTKIRIGTKYGWISSADPDLRVALWGALHLPVGHTNLTVDAVDAEMALEFAREHYGQDQVCVHIWVVPRSAMLGTDYERDIIWRSTDRNYKLARGYQVHNRWLKFRSNRDVKEYEKEDLKEHY